MILKIGYQSCSEIPALKSGSWRIISKPTGIYPSWLSDMDSLAFVHRAFHWLGLSEDESVPSYDEVFKEKSIARWNVCGSGHELRQSWPFCIGRNNLYLL
ncbi:hypothetical protein FXO37_14777 [Capsicum annuum]|nr:hypothetical protein FXO37_14777 [Capsicum annuum]